MVFTAHNTFELREFVTLSPDKWRVWSANGCLGIYWLCHSTWYILVGSHTGVYVCKHLLTHELLYTSFTQLANNQIPIWFTNHVFRIFCSIIIPIQSYFCRVLGFKNPDRIYIPLYCESCTAVVHYICDVSMCSLLGVVCQVSQEKRSTATHHHLQHRCRYRQSSNSFHRDCWTGCCHYWQDDTVQISIGLGCRCPPIVRVQWLYTFTASNRLPER